MNLALMGSNCGSRNHCKLIMNQITTRSFILALVFGAYALTTLSLHAAKGKTEDQLIADLDSPKASVVTGALQKLEKEYPTSTKAFPKMKTLLTDSRPDVRRKAARVLGILHAEVDAADLKAICALLKGSTPAEIIDGLKALRGLKAASVIPEILPSLQSPTVNVIRDACRTLAVLGNKDLIPKIEPLLNHPHAAVKKDAQDAIFALKSKS